MNKTDKRKLEILILSTALKLPLSEKNRARLRRSLQKRLAAQGTPHPKVRPEFDKWWYTQTYLLGTEDEGTDPEEHYNRIGASKGYRKRPRVPIRFNDDYSRTFPLNGRRICLFAAYDAEGTIDASVLNYLKDLSRYADIYYLADCHMDDIELSKLDGIVKGAWAKRHGMYDFGSYSILARDLVGWEKIEQYDELIFANDSCYLVHPLGNTFSTMAARPCAWWGLQPTKGLISTRHQNRIPENEPVPIGEIKEKYLTEFEEDPVYDFLIGSYFLVFRKDVIADAGFRRVINAVDKEKDKLSIVLKYEIGITRFLISKGYEFDTLTDSVSKQHPDFSARAFDLIDRGFPLLKRYLLAENHHKVKNLAAWKLRIEAANPEADIVAMEANLLRVGNAHKIYHNLRIGLANSPRSHAKMAKEDARTPKFDHWWAFPVCRYSHLLNDNSRAIFEAVKNDPSIKKIVLTRSKHVEVDGVNIVNVPLHSYEGQTYLLRSKQVFLRHGVEANIEYPLSSDLHNFYNLWHGIPLKRIGVTSLDQKGNVKIIDENKRLKCVISSSDVDHLAMAAAYWPLTYHDIWVTGLPRHDIINCKEEDLPQYQLAQSEKIKSRLAGRRFILFAPTFRADQEDGYYTFSDPQLQQLSAWLERHDILMGIREHMADRKRLYSSQMRGPRFFDASEKQYPDIEVLYRNADMLLTDYSSCFIDFMLTGRPMASFAFDQSSYRDEQRGLFYDQEMVFPGPVCTDFDSLMLGLEKLTQEPDALSIASYEWKTKFFHKYRDANNSQRVISKVKEAYDSSNLIWNTKVSSVTKTNKDVIFLYSKNNQITNRYRIDNLLQELQSLGWNCKKIDASSLTLEDIKSASTLFICRIAMNDRLIDLCEQFKLNGGKIVYDTDDLLHDFEAFKASEYYRLRPQSASYNNYLSQRTLELIDTSDFVTVTTESLRDSMLSRGKEVAVVRNSLSKDLLLKYANSETPKTDGVVKICYLSGTATHSEDFAQCEAALIHVLDRLENVEVHIVGELRPNVDNKNLSANRFITHPIMSYEDMHDFLSRMDVNVAPLASSLFNDCKSELKIFEAALHRIPTIASPSRSYAGAIQNGINGILASSSEEWKHALISLIENPEKRRMMGEAAFNEIVPMYSYEASARTLSNVFQYLMDKKAQ